MCLVVCVSLSVALASLLANVFDVLGLVIVVLACLFVGLFGWLVVCLFGSFVRWCVRMEFMCLCVYVLVSFVCLFLSVFVSFVCFVHCLFVLMSLFVLFICLFVGVGSFRCRLCLLRSPSHSPVS